MSSPDTNTKKDAKRHKGPLLGLVGVVLFAVVLLGILSIYVVNRGNEPANQQPIGEEPAAATDETVDVPVTEAEGE